MKFSNTYLNLGDAFFQKVLPQNASSPELLLWNAKLADSLSISKELQADKSLLAQYFSGNKLLAGTEAIALAYSGHQFGHFNPQLGDGRAHLLGEVIDENNSRQDIQLKGSGQTKYSRRGDGKCALAPALREYIMSEALYALGVPTTRCLSVVATGDTINRGIAKHGAVVTRTAASHIRVGTFQYFAVFGDLGSLKQLLDYTIERHFPRLNTQIKEENLAFDDVVLGFLTCALDKQIALIIEWLRIGFIHGVMNTDNTVISGETIDFGPCAMMGNYDKNAVFSSIDEYGRYAFGKQGHIAQWNMARLADCLLPMLIEFYSTNDQANGQANNSEKTLKEKAIKAVESVIHQYSHKFDDAYYNMYAKKLGFGDELSTEVRTECESLTDDLLEIMQEDSLDYTRTFHILTTSLEKSLTSDDKVKRLPEELGEKLTTWQQKWHALLEKQYTESQHSYAEQAQAVMAKANPVVIPRNHHIEALLEQCEQALSDEKPESYYHAINEILADFLKVIASPYIQLDATSKYQDAAADGDKHYRTFCGT